MIFALDRKGKRKLSERDIEKACSDFLSLDGWRPLKTNPVSNRERGAGFGEKGMADYLYIRYKPWGHSDPPLPVGWEADAAVLWIEWKSAKGKPKPHQRRWHEAERARGALTWIAGVDFPASVDGFMDWYRSSGLLRRHGL